MEIGAPVWKPRETSYTFPIRFTASMYELPTESQYIECDGSPDAVNDIQEEDKVSILIPFIDAFLTKTKGRFATPLLTKNVLSRLSHVWMHSEGPHVQEPGWYVVKWEPKEFIVKPRDFVIVWTPTTYTPTEPKIPTEFLEAATPGHQSPAPEVRTIQIQPSSNPHGLIELEPPLVDPADDRLMTVEYDTSDHSTEKKRIREARLRAALASLKAERLAEKYYQKYGIQAGDDSSELSSDNESEDGNY